MLTPGDLDIVEANCGRACPSAYRHFLERIGNGASLFNLSLYGLVQRIDRLGSLPLGQPISLDYGNSIERPKGLRAESFAIGGMVGWSSRGVLIMEPAGEVALVHLSDGEDVAAQWPDLDTMLTSEIQRLASLYDRSGYRQVPSSQLMHPGGRRWETEPEEPRPSRSVLGRLIRQFVP